MGRSKHFMYTIDWTMWYAAGPLSLENPAELIDLISNQTISGRIAKDVFEIMFETGGAPGAIIEEKGLKHADAVSSASVMTRRVVDLSELKGKVPFGKIRHAEISRVVPGGNRR